MTKEEVTKEDEDDDEEDTVERKKTKTKQRGRQLVKERRVKVTINIANWQNNKGKTLTPKVCSSGGKEKEYKLPSIHRYVVL